MEIKNLPEYELIFEKEIKDVSSQGYYFRHKKSGARVAVLSNDDDNKVFYIGFRTPPVDNCGVPHIIEHTTLCGSDKYPLKDPFVELIKGSMNTFINAITYPDKTIYPVASCNDQDYKNLMDVYLDAVFHPNLLKKEEIFKQEGWHYELEDPDGEITINGVVYNEMKGAYSDPSEVLSTAQLQALFPDTTYSKNSGGAPEEIPDLTYEHYVDMYRRFYHPSNSYIYLYGDMDVEERLRYLDREYLSRYDRADISSEIGEQKAFDQVLRYETSYSISSEDKEENRTQLAYSMVVETVLDQELCGAMEVLKHALISGAGAPVRQALIDAGIGEDVYGSFEDDILQPVFSIVARNANREDEKAFVEIIRKTLEQQVKEGVSEEALLASINSSEFSFREGDYGLYPKGLFYGIDMLGSWLHQEEDPFRAVECIAVYKHLRDKIGTGYYEELIKKYLLDNAHGSVVVVTPEKGLSGKREADLKKKLSDYKASLSAAELEKLTCETRALKVYQEEPTADEDLRKIPMLTRKDMRKEALPFSNIEEELGQAKVVRHQYETNGIDYLSLMFDVSDIPAEELPLLGILRKILGDVDTKNYTYAQMDNAINIYTGGISFSLGRYVRESAPDDLSSYMEVRIKVLENNLKKAFELTDEILFSSVFSDTKRLREIMIRERARLQNSLSGSGHYVASMRALSGVSPYAFHIDATNGIRMYQGLCRLVDQMDKEPECAARKIQKLAEKIFAKNRLLVSFTAPDEAWEKAKPTLAGFIEKMPKDSPMGEKPVYPKSKVREAFTDASQIQYVARVGRFTDHGFADNGYMRILRTLLGYEYLWLNIRVKGGAYGCGSNSMRTGETYFSSYRDPNLSVTNEVFEKIPEYLENFNVDEREMTKYIIGTFSSLDTPLYPEAKGARSMSAFLQDITIGQQNHIRDQIIHADCQDIRDQAALVRSVLEEGRICAIGNENKIREEAGLFEKIRPLY